MTLHTPVVFSNGNTAIEKVAIERGWRVVQQASCTLRLLGTNETVEMPDSRMNIQAGSLDPQFVPSWNKVIAWLKRHVTRPMLVMGPNHGLTDLALFAHAAHAIPHGAWLTDIPVAMTPTALALLSSAEGMAFTDAGAEALFRRSWPAPVTNLPNTALIDLPDRPTLQPSRQVPGVTNVLLVAYYAGPSPTVGVQRINYWFERMAELSEGRVRVDLALATAWPDAPDQVHVVPDLGPAEVCRPGGQVDAWGLAHIEHINDAARSYSVTGGFWHLSLEKYFDAREDDYDVVIISGNPFSYFEFARYAKQRWYAATVLDYRDPFSQLPRALWGAEQQDRARQDEIGWNFAADMITVVNDVCAALVVNHNPAAEVVVVPNGWDDGFPLPAQVGREGSAVRLAHAGQWYRITHPEALIDAVSRTGVELHQFGPDLPSFGRPGIRNHGRRSKQALYEQLATMHCGVTFSSEQGFETPTKVFDYLALGLDVLVLYQGEAEGSALHTLLDGTEGVHWVENTPEHIAAFLTDYRPAAGVDPARALLFSRRTSTQRFLEHILELGDHSYTPPAL